MKAFSAKKRVAWNIVLGADAVPATNRAVNRDRGNLQRLVRSVLPEVKADLAGSPLSHVAH